MCYSILEGLIDLMVSDNSNHVSYYLFKMKGHDRIFHYPGKALICKSVVMSCLNVNHSLVEELFQKNMDIHTSLQFGYLQKKQNLILSLNERDYYT